MNNFIAKYKWLAPVIISAVTILTFYPCIMNDFVNYDDQALLFRNNIIKEFSLANTVSIFKAHIRGRYSRFMPLVFTTYMTIYRFAKFDALAFHLVSLLFHIGCTIIVFYLAYLIAANVLVAFICAILFGSHPFHVEAVAWISSLTHVMASFFYLLTILLYVLAIKKPSCQVRYYIFSFIAFIFAGICFSGAAVTLSLTLVLISYFLESRITIKRTFTLVPFFILSACLIYLTINSAKNADIITNPYFTAQTYSLSERIHLSSVSIFMYLLRLIFPHKFCVVYPTGYYAHSINFLFTIIGLLLLWLVFRNKKENFRLTDFRFGILFFLITIFPFLQLYSTSDSIINDRYVYLSAFGIFFILAKAIHQLLCSSTSIIKNRLPLIKITICAYLIYVAFFGWQRCFIWRNGETLWTDVINRYPEAHPAYVARARHYLQIHSLGKATKDLDKALLIHPDYFDALSVKGNVFLVSGRLQEAIQMYSKALSINDKHIQTLNNRASTYLFLRKYQEAQRDLDKSIAIDPGQVSAYYNRGILAFRQHRYDDALKNFKVVLIRDPYHQLARNEYQKTLEVINRRNID